MPDKAEAWKEMDDHPLGFIFTKEKHVPKAEPLERPLLKAYNEKAMLADG